jgi:predicted DNA-binding transcriptional regulator AlpA
VYVYSVQRVKLLVACLAYRQEMVRKLDVQQLVGATEIAERLGVSRGQVVHNWRARFGDFPEPVHELAMGMLWYWPEVAEWASAHGKGN